MKYKLITLFIFLFLMACSEPSIDDIEFTLNPSVDTIIVYETYEDPGAEATLNDQVIEVEVIENTVNNEVIGDYHIIYQISYNDQVRTLTRKVSVIAENDYSITLNPGVDTIRVGETWIDQGVTLSHEEEFTVQIDGQVNTNEAGIYTIYYIAENEEGILISIQRIVTVID